MSAPYRAKGVVPGQIVTNGHGYAMNAGAGGFTIVDGQGFAIRTHDGFAFFDTEKQAAWCAELMGGARSDGEDFVKAAMRDLLGIEAVVA